MIRYWQWLLKCFGYITEWLVVLSTACSDWIAASCCLWSELSEISDKNKRYRDKMSSSQFDNTVKNHYDKSLNAIIQIMTKTVNYKLVLFSHFLFLHLPFRFSQGRWPKNSITSGVSVTSAPDCKHETQNINVRLVT